MKAKEFIYRVVKYLSHMLGYDLVIAKKLHGKSDHELIIPYATYAPWKTDKQFRDVYSTIQNYTMVDIYRCYELWNLVAQASKLPGAILEVGVWRGGTGALIAKRAKMFDKNRAIYLCDTFTGLIKSGKHDPVFKDGDFDNASKESVKKLLTTLQLLHVHILEGRFPEDTATLIRSDKISFCHIDVDVYQSAKDIYDWVWPKLAMGGIIVFDDYGFHPCKGITKFVDELRKEKNCAIMHNLNGQAVVIKMR